MGVAYSFSSPSHKHLTLHIYCRRDMLMGVAFSFSSPSHKHLILHIYCGITMYQHRMTSLDCAPSHRVVYLLPTLSISVTTQYYLLTIVISMIIHKEVIIN